MGNSSFACNDPVPAVFLKDNQSCTTCWNKPTQHSCDERQALCGSAEPVCQSEVLVRSGKVSVYKSCGTYTDCLLRARKNHRLCNATHSDEGSVSDLNCTFCCSGLVCNQLDMGGRTRSFMLYVGVRLVEQFQDYLRDSHDPQTTQKATIFAKKLDNIFQPVSGGYEPSFLSFREDLGQVFVTSIVHVTVLNVYSVGDVGRLMTGALNDSAKQGFLYEQKADFIYVGTEHPPVTHLDLCPQEVTQTEVGALSWPETSAGFTVQIPCPGAPAGSNRTTIRVCNRAGKWNDLDINACRKSDVTDGLKELNSTNITPGNVNSVLTQLVQLTSDGPSLTSTDVTLAVDMVERSLTYGEVLQSGGSSLSSSLRVVSNVLDAESSVLVKANRESQSAVRLLAVTDRVGAEGSLGKDGQLLLTSPNVVVGALAVDKASFQGATLTAHASTDQQFQPGDVQILPQSSKPSTNVTNLVIPPSLLADSSGSRIALKALTSDKLFKVIQQSKKNAVSDSDSNPQESGQQINSHVLDATVVGYNVSNLADPVTFTFVHLIENASRPVCVFWDVRNTQWSSEGCREDTVLSTNSSSTCRCDHLTNFALLMDVYGQGSFLSEANKRALSIISYVGCAVSLLCLLLTLLTYVLFNFRHSYGSWSVSEEKLRRDNPSKILVNLCVALAVSNLVFVAGMQPYALDSLVGCKVVAVLLHFSLLAALTWMAVEAFYMYLALVLVFKTYFTNFILKCSLVGWGIPLVIVAITLGVNETDNYGPLNSGVCWLKGLAFYVAFLAPVGLILLINFVAFGLVLKQILGLSQRKLNRSDSFSTAQQFRGAIGVVILLGLTWVFALFAIDRASVVFYYLFAIFNSLQGLWIFVFYCLLKKEARNAWRRTLPCCPTPDDKSTISHTRAGYSATNTRTEHGKSSSGSGGGTTTTAFTSSSANSESEKPDLGPSNKVDKEKPVSAVVPIQQTNYHHLKDDSQPSSFPSFSSKTGCYVVNSEEDDDHITRLSVSGGKYIPHSTTPQSESKPQFPKNGSGDDEDSPRPLHFKAGYTLSNTSTGSEGQAEEDTTSSSPRHSVAEIIRLMNNTKL